MRLHSDMKLPEDSQGRGPVGYAFLSRKELSLFRRLIDGRRSLPIYRAGGWLCYECPFTSANLAVMARHIVRAHGAAPPSKDDLDEDDPDTAYPAGRAGGLRLGSAFTLKIFRRHHVTMNGRANPSYMLVKNGYSVPFTR